MIGDAAYTSHIYAKPDRDRLPGAAIIRGVGGEARRTTAGGVVWAVAGAPTAVAEVCAALEGAEPPNRVIA